MASYNYVALLGNLTRDPELRVTPKGTAICQFGLAINRKTKTGEEVTFVDCEAWDKAAENIAKYCTKGKQLMVNGRLKLDSWDDKTTGQKRSKLKVVVEGFQLLGGRDEGASSASSENQQPEREHADETRMHTTPGGGAQDIDSAEIPF